MNNILRALVSGLPTSVVTTTWSYSAVTHRPSVTGNKQIYAKEIDVEHSIRRIRCYASARRQELPVLRLLLTQSGWRMATG
jgi:hypothetical protein